MADGLSDEQVRELIHITYGGIKERRAHWYTLGIPIDHYYTTDEQLAAIRRLSISGNPIAWEYLKRMPVTHVVLDDPGIEHGRGPDTPINEDDYNEDIVFPNAKGELSSRITYSLGESGAKRVLEETLSPFLKELETIEPRESTEIRKYFA